MTSYRPFSLMQLLLLAGRGWSDDWPDIQISYLRFMSTLEYILEGKRSWYNMDFAEMEREQLAAVARAQAYNHSRGNP